MKRKKRKDRKKFYFRAHFDQMRTYKGFAESKRGQPGSVVVMSSSGSYQNGNNEEEYFDLDPKNIHESLEAVKLYHKERYPGLKFRFRVFQELSQVELAAEKELRARKKVGPPTKKGRDRWAKPSKHVS